MHMHADLGKEDQLVPSNSDFFDDTMFSALSEPCLLCFMCAMTSDCGVFAQSRFNILTCVYLQAMGEEMICASRTLGGNN